MRLWHSDLIKYLPKQQLIAQWRELNSIYVKQDDHILINYIYDYSKYHIMKYSLLVINEIEKRGYKIKSFENLEKYTGYSIKFIRDSLVVDSLKHPFHFEHNLDYLKICCWNLYEKYLRGQKGFSDESINYIKTIIDKE